MRDLIARHTQAANGMLDYGFAEAMADAEDAYYDHVASHGGPDPQCDRCGLTLIERV